MATIQTDNSMFQEVSYAVPFGKLCGKLWGNPLAENKMIALHGWLDNAGTFDGLFPLLFSDARISNSYSILALDLPGHGLSSHLSDGYFYSYSEYVINVKRVIDKIGWKKVSLLGHSKGGGVALLLAVSIEEMMSKLIVIDEFYFETITGNEMFSSHLKEVLSKVDAYTKSDGYKVYATMDEIVSRILSGNKHLTEAAAKSLAIRGCHEVEGGYAFSRDLRLRAPEPMMLMSESFLEFAQKVNNRVTFPSLFILPLDSEYPDAQDVIKQGLKLPENRFVLTELFLNIIRLWLSRMDNSSKASPETEIPVSNSEPQLDNDISIRSKDSQKKNQESSIGTTERIQEVAEDEDSKKMFVGALSPSTDDGSMKQYFLQFGEIVNLTIKYDPISKRSKGYGFLTFGKKESVDKVLTKQEHMLDGRLIDPKRLESRKLTGTGGQTKKIFVGGVPTCMSKGRIEGYFGAKGEIDEVALVTNKQTNTRRGFVFITFKSERIVDDLVEERFHTIDGYRVEVKKATPREQQLNNKLNGELQISPLIAQNLAADASGVGMYSQFSPYYPYPLSFPPYSYGYYGSLYGMGASTQPYVPVHNPYGTSGDSYNAYR
ncbi:Heterogeneous nuclear ribonucleoprotein A/B isoform X2 [Oopsacas minuta]|uniref:Heterogeneous nuclear ribonucleoprotein A/B isoform X2 n=1 Tax=Oopsacas minuta TaxID=111878 RepID=A0AAV7KDG8_9METZ|nr:Heterogeneous nuclear ribonucleoprotein A/B isoform X2 [Oopsacas minuta]